MYAVIAVAVCSTVFSAFSFIFYSTPAVKSKKILVKNSKQGKAAPMLKSV